MKSLLALIFTVSSAYATEININYSAANDLVLTSAKCEDLVKQHQAICQWKKVLDPAFVIPTLATNSCKKISSAQYSMTVSSCLPEFAKAFQHKKLYKHGANCWGTALNFKKISKRPRFIWSQEMMYWLSSPVCRKLNPGEAKRPGDIISTHGPEHVFAKEETNNKGILFWESLYPGRVTAARVDYGYSGYHNFLHSETYVSDLITFGKDSPNKLDKFEFHNMNEVYGRSKDVNCQENQSMTPYYRENQNQPKPIKGSKCDYFSLAYRCENFDAYFSKQDLTTRDEDTLAIIKKLQGMQEKLFPLQSVAGKTIPKTEMNQMLNEADRVVKETLDELRVPGLNKNHEMLLTLKYFTAAGIRKSLEQAELIPATEAL